MEIAFQKYFKNNHLSLCIIKVYVILFGVGETATEGIYSLRTHSVETGLHVETIVCFETNEDAFR